MARGRLVPAHGCPFLPGYACRVKTAVSIPDDVFEQAERLARRNNVSRSELYATALRALLADDAAVTEQLNRVYRGDDAADVVEPVVTAAARKTFTSTDW
jgi:hypothetical protein